MPDEGTMGCPPCTKVSMEFPDLVRFVRSYARLIIATTAAAIVAAVILTAVLPRTYVATAQLVVGPSLSGSVRDYNQLLSAQALAQTYAQAARTNALAERVTARLGTDESPTEFLERVAVETDRDTAILNITVRGDRPEAAAEAANAIGDDLIAESVAIQGRDEQILTLLTEQIEGVQEQIASTSERIADLQGIEDPSAAEIAEIGALQGQLTASRQTLATLLTTVQESSASSVSFLDRAVPPAGPDSPRPLVNLLLATLLGLMAGLLLAAIRASLDDTFESSDEIDEMLDVPLLGVISRIPLAVGHQPFYSLAMLTQPRSVAAESFRSLRTNVEALLADGGKRTILVTSPGSLDGKSTVAANLAIAFAQSGKRTILVDADLRRPSMQELFRLSDGLGLGDVLASDIPDLRSMWQATDAQDLLVMPAGTLPDQPAELLGSPRLPIVLQRLEAAADVVIIDTPPVLAAADTPILASRVSQVLLVIARRHTDRRSARAAEAALRRVGASILGVVYNRRSGGETRDDDRELYSYEPLPVPLREGAALERQR
jgi:capsular exopolysaccharide synthesis family protein